MKKVLLLSLCIFLSYFPKIAAQCSLVCKQLVNVSMPAEICYRTLSPSDLISEPMCQGLTVKIVHPFGTNQNIADDAVDRSHLSYTMIYKVEQAPGVNSCWGYIKVEDKSGPAVPCKNTTVSCFQISEINRITEETQDACSDLNSRVVVNLIWEDYGCDSVGRIGRLVRNVLGSDAWGNINNCNDTITIRKDNVDSVCCPSTIKLPCRLYCLNGERLFASNNVNSGLFDAKNWDLLQFSPDKSNPNYPSPELLIKVQGKDDPIVKLGLIRARWAGTKILVNNLIIPGGLIGLNQDTFCIHPDSLVVPYLKDSILDLQKTGKKIVGFNDNGTFETIDTANERFCTVYEGKTAMYPYLGGLCKLTLNYRDELLTICGNGFKIRREWHIIDWCTGAEKICVQYIIVEDKLNPTPIFTGIPNSPGPLTTVITGLRDTVYYLRTVSPHDCNANFTINRMNVWDCNSVKEQFSFVYRDPNNGRTISVSKEVGPNGASISLPVGLYIGQMSLTDLCLNSCAFPLLVLVEDVTPPTPVCDEISQTTVDPATCWARVYAKDLDNGSKDNCCNNLHFAIARMDTLEYYRKEYTDHIIKICGWNEYANNKVTWDFLVNEYLSTYVFTDYLDLTECGVNSVVLRIFDACKIARYDPHITTLTEHKWVMAQVYGLYFVFSNLDPNYQLLKQIELVLSPSAALALKGFKLSVLDSEDCERLLFLKVLAILRSVVRQFVPGLLPLNDSNPNFKIIIDLVEGNAGAFCIPEFNLDIGFSFEEFQNELDGPTAAAESGIIPFILNLCHSIYNDCMVNVKVDDKTPPVCEGIRDLYYYCDGVFEVKENEFPDGTAEYASDYCYLVKPRFENYTCGPYKNVEYTSENEVNEYAGTDSSDYNDPTGRFYGYYGCITGVSGHPIDEHNPMISECPNNVQTRVRDVSEYSNGWVPIYCHSWLALDKYDHSGKFTTPKFWTPKLISYGPKGTPKAGTENGEFRIWDNCILGTPTTKDDSYIDQCGNGWLSRTWTVGDKCETSIISCTQKIYTKHRSDFEVMFPEDVVVVCGSDDNLSPEITGKPAVWDDDCELVGVHYTDVRYDIVADACYKIVRTWTLIDWCKYDPNLHNRHPEVIYDDRTVASADRYCVFTKLKDDGDGYMTYTQIIKVKDTLAPVVTCSNDTLCISTGYNGAGAEPDIMCSVPAYSKIFTATDNCTATSQIEFRYEIKNVGGIIRKSGPKVTGFTAIAGDLTVGVNTLTIIAADKCGQEDTTSCTITVKDCKKPTPYCYDGIATVIMPSSGEVTVWASDLNAGSYDNCTKKADLLFTFDAAGLQLSKVYKCADSKPGQVTIYVWDKTKNSDYCTVSLSIQSNDPNCQPAAGVAAAVAGKIITEISDPIQNVNVELKTSVPMPLYKTDLNGTFAFNGLPIKADIILTPKLDENPMNGISTIDLLIIQKHLLGIETLTSPYHIIAADVDKSNDVSSVDLVELRKLILTIYEKLPNAPSWRFVPKSYVFANSTNPWGVAHGDPSKVGFPEKIEIKALDKDQLNNDFIGIKVGDVNGTVLSHQLLGTEVRGAGDALKFRTLDRQLRAGEEATIEFTADNFTNIEGYQFSLSVKGLELKAVHSGILKVSEGNFGLTRMGEGYITTSWNQTSRTESLSTSSRDVLFSLKVKAIKSVTLSEVLAINSMYTRAEAYHTASGNATLGVSLEIGNKPSGFTLYQNTPNPFKSSTIIGFDLVKSEKVTLKITDVTGKLVKIFALDGMTGSNQLKVSHMDLLGSGVFYYTLETSESRSTKKLVLLN